MNNEKMIKNLKAIKESLLISDAVEDTIWISASETTVERIDSMLIALGCKYEDLEKELDAIIEKEHGCRHK